MKRNRAGTIRDRLFVWLTGVMLCLTPLLVTGQDQAQSQAPTQPSEEGIPKVTGPPAATTLDALSSFVELRSKLLQDIKQINRQLASAHSDAEKQALRQELDKLESDLRGVRRNFENIAAGIDISELRAEQEEEFNFQKELFGLLKPALDEMKDMTSKVRQKSELREKIADFQERLPVVEKALANIDRLLDESRRKAVTEALQLTADEWRQKQTLVQTELQAAQLQLQELVAQDVSFSEASRSYLKSFFEKRGLYLTEALLVLIGVLVLARLSLATMRRYVPGFRKPHRSFRIRLAELLHRLVTLVLLIAGPMVVFYLVEDWVLFSLGILLLLGVALTLRHTLPRYIKQIQLFLNVGSVREGERLLLDGLPWRVQEINFFSILVNPDANLTQRVAIEDLIDCKSRPASRDEPWFPCRKDDWVILGDGVRGKVIGISPELVRLVERGGAHLTYQMAEFLGSSPRNLGTNFRVKETLGISYALQKDSTTRIPETLRTYIQRRIEEEGFGEQLLNLRVEFERANISSLDIVVIADFKGELGDLYNRLRRAIQRWCVDACTQYGWEIPFPQLTLHGALDQRDSIPLGIEERV